MSANQLLARPQPQVPTPEPSPNPQVDLAKAALEVQNNSLVQKSFAIHPLIQSQIKIFLGITKVSH